MSPERGPTLTPEQLKRTIDLVAFVQRYTSLHPLSRRGEYAGPCPFCGGEDRFHVKAGRFYCRQCTPRGGDVLDLVQRLHNLSFREACAYLQSDPSFFSERQSVQPPTDPETFTPAWQNPEYQASAARTVAATHRLLLSPEGERGQAYLHGRGVSEATWVRYRLGYGRTLHPTRRQNLEAIFLPWVSADGQTITALQHRFIDPHLSRSERYTLKPGSLPLVFGLQALAQAETLYIVEGELNAMALQQVGVQAVSVGSEVNTHSRAVLDLLEQVIEPYTRIIVWCDQLASAQYLLARLQQTAPFRKKEGRAVAYGQDANELLVAGQLTAVLSTMIEQ